MDFNVSTINGHLIQWLINGSDTCIDWSKPTLEYVQDGNLTFEDKLNVFEINKKDEWVFWYIQAVHGDPIGATHPMYIRVSTALLLNSIRKSLANTLIQGHGKPFAISLL
jgi:hypothetical protein